MTAAHVSFRQAALFGKTDILDLAGFSPPQILFGCKAAIKAGFERIASVDLFLPLQHRYRQVGIGRVAFGDDTIQNQIGSAAGHTDLVTKKGLAPVLDDNVGMRFKQRHHFVFGSDYRNNKGDLLYIRPPFIVPNRLFFEF